MDIVLMNLAEDIGVVVHAIVMVLDIVHGLDVEVQQDQLIGV